MNSRRVVCTGQPARSVFPRRRSFRCVLKKIQRCTTEHRSTCGAFAHHAKSQHDVIFWRLCTSHRLYYGEHKPSFTVCAAFATRSKVVVVVVPRGINSKPDVCKLVETGYFVNTYQQHQQCVSCMVSRH